MEWGSMAHEVSDCIAVTSFTSASDVTNNVYMNRQIECKKTAGPGVARQIDISRKDRNESASKLSVGDWVIFDSGEEDDPIWLGRVMSHPDWGGQGVQQNVTRRIQSYPSGAKIGRNEVAMNIIWYEKMDISLDALDYQVSRSFTSPIVQNNKYFIPITVNMHRVLGGVKSSSKIENFCEIKHVNQCQY